MNKTLQNLTARVYFTKSVIVTALKQKFPFKRFLMFRAEFESFDGGKLLATKSSMRRVTGEVGSTCVRVSTCWNLDPSEYYTTGNGTILVLVITLPPTLRLCGHVGENPSLLLHSPGIF